MIHEPKLVVGVGVQGRSTSSGPLDWPGLALRNSAQMHRKSSLYRSIGLKGDTVSQEAKEELSPPPGISSRG